MSDLDLGAIYSTYDLRRTQYYAYVYYPILAFMIYDSLELLPREVQYIYRKSWSLIQVIYIMFRVNTCLLLVDYTYGRDGSFVRPRLTVWSQSPRPIYCPLRCRMSSAIVALETQIILPAMLKTLLILRLRAIWGRDLKITIILVFTTAVEIIFGTMRAIGYYIIVQKYAVDRFPLHGCAALGASPVLVELVNIFAILNWVARTIGTSIEAVLTFIKLLQALKTAKLAGGSFRKRLAYFREFMPIIYVFYRDGTVLIVPLLVTSVLNLYLLLAAYNRTLGLIVTDLAPSYALVYYVCGTRLILNVREANCRLTETIVSRKHTTLRFNDQGGSDGTDSELSDGLEDITSEGCR